MAWTAPMTAVANTVFTADQFNIHVRDNLLQTAPAKATAEGGYYIGNAANSIVERFPQYAAVDTSQTTQSTSYTDLATSGPAITVTTGTRALVIHGANMSNNTINGFAVMGITISGASSISANDAKAFAFKSGVVDQSIQACWTELYTTLTPGSNIFTAKYKTTNAAHTATFLRRHLTVIPF